MLEFILAILIGVIIGTFTGLIPGIHINLVAALITSTALVSGLSATTLALAIIALAITHTFIDTIPSIYLGAPEEDSALSVLPGHQLLMKGEGHHAVLYTLIGSIISILLFPLVIIAFSSFMPVIFPSIQRMMGWFLIQFSLLLIYLEKDMRLQSTVIFLLSGFLGIASLNMPTAEPLLPLFTGLFGVSTLIHSVKSNTIVPKQITTKPTISKKELIAPAIATISTAPICSFFPGLGSSQAAIIGSRIVKNLSQKQFLILIGSVNTLVMATSFITLVVFAKTRTGAAIVLSGLETIPSLRVIGIGVISAAIIATPITLFLSKTVAKYIGKINYSKISITTIGALTLLVTGISGFTGLLILIAATFTGLTCIEMGVRKGFLMGCLLIPTLLFYLPF